MKALNEEELIVLSAALNHYQRHNDTVISQYYLDDDKNQIVSDTIETIQTVANLQSNFSDNKLAFILNEEEYSNIQAAFERAEEIYTNNDNVIMKASIYLALIDTIKANLRIQ